MNLDRIHSAGIVLGDRSVLYKYTNPNLIAVVTEGVDYQKGLISSDNPKRIDGKDKCICLLAVPFVNVYLLDTVTGSIKLSHTHKRVKAPVHVVLAENWIVVSRIDDVRGKPFWFVRAFSQYTYYNQRYRRYEAVSSIVIRRSNTIQLFGLLLVRSPWNLSSNRKRTSLQYGVNAIQVTTTEKGITSRDIISEHDDVFSPSADRLFSFSGDAEWNVNWNPLDVIRSTTTARHDADGSVKSSSFFAFETTFSL